MGLGGEEKDLAVRVLGDIENLVRRQGRIDGDNDGSKGENGQIRDHPLVAGIGQDDDLVPLANAYLLETQGRGDNVPSEGFRRHRLVLSVSDQEASLLVSPPPQEVPDKGQIRITIFQCLTAHLGEGDDPVSSLVSWKSKTP